MKNLALMTIALFCLTLLGLQAYAVEERIDSGKVLLSVPDHSENSKDTKVSEQSLTIGKNSISFNDKASSGVSRPSDKSGGDDEDDSDDDEEDTRNA